MLEKITRNEQKLEGIKKKLNLTSQTKIQKRSKVETLLSSKPVQQLNQNVGQIETQLKSDLSQLLEQNEMTQFKIEGGGLVQGVTKFTTFSAFVT